MNNWIDLALRVICIGVGSTIVMDIWLMLLKRLNVPTLNFALIGRWVGHIFQGQWFHQSIAKATPVKGELLMGWCAHYMIGILFAVLLVVTYGLSWLQQPTLGFALLFGMVTVLAPFLIMQPAMGSGIASAKTATPWKNRFKSLASHTVFGAGLYVAALLMTL
jgi:hypothetical protein